MVRCGSSGEAALTIKVNCWRKHISLTGLNALKRIQRKLGVLTSRTKGNSQATCMSKKKGNEKNSQITKRNEKNKKKLGNYRKRVTDKQMKSCRLWRVDFVNIGPEAISQQQGESSRTNGLSKVAIQILIHLSKHTAAPSDPSSNADPSSIWFHSTNFRKFYQSLLIRCLVNAIMLLIIDISLNIL